MDDDAWRDVREQAERLDPGAELETPVSDRQFRIGATFEDRIVIRFRDSGEERTLWRDEFDALDGRLDHESLPIRTLSPGVEPYAVVLTLTGRYAVVDDAIDRAPEDGTAGESPYLVAPSAARTRPERVRDDAVLLADYLERVDASEPAALETDSLVDCYVLLSDVQRGADRLRSSVNTPLLERLGPDQQLHGQFGTVTRTTREYRRPKDDDTVLDALDEHGIPHEWVLGIDPDKLDVVLAVTDLEPGEVYDVDEQVYVQKTGVDESEKYARLQGLRDRLDGVEGDDAERLREDIEELEDRLEETLSGE